MIPNHTRTMLQGFANSSWSGVLEECLHKFNEHVGDHDPYVLFVFDASKDDSGKVSFRDRVIARFIDMSSGGNEQDVEDYLVYAERKYVELSEPHDMDSGDVVRYHPERIDKDAIRFGGCVLRSILCQGEKYRIGVTSSGKWQDEDHALSLLMLGLIAREAAKA
jgi:hypothetical protein